MGLAHAAENGVHGHAGDRTTRRRASRTEPRGGLVSLLAHDLRVPLGPLALATSSLASDPGLDGLAREYARIAHAQSAKVGRLMSAALAASGRLSSVRPARLPVVSLLRDTGEAFASLGGTLHVDGEDAVVVADPAMLGECFLNVAELVSGARYTTTATVEPGDQVIVSFACDEVERVAAAFSKDAPDDSDSAFALASIVVAGAFGGTVELTEGEVALAFPPAEVG